MIMLACGCGHEWVARGRAILEMIDVTAGPCPGCGSLVGARSAITAPDPDIWDVIASLGAWHVRPVRLLHWRVMTPRYNQRLVIVTLIVRSVADVHRGVELEIIAEVDTLEAKVTKHWMAPTIDGVRKETQRMDERAPLRGLVLDLLVTFALNRDQVPDWQQWVRSVCRGHGSKG